MDEMQGAMRPKIVAPTGTEFIKHYHIIVTTHYWESESSYIFILQKYCVRTEFSQRSNFIKSDKFTNISGFFWKWGCTYFGTSGSFYGCIFPRTSD